jgi:WD40 repeat protein
LSRVAPLFCWFGAAALLGLASPALAAAPAAAPAAPKVPRAIREPVRLTAGASSELMGVLSPDETALYFVSDASGTLDINVQAPLQTGPVALSNGLGDAAWPQISPDGKHIAYVSFENDATGDVCIRALSKPEGEEATGAAVQALEEKCLTNSESAELQVLWWDTGSLGVLSRRGLHGNFELERVPIDGSPPTTLLARNMVGLAVSPDRRWLAYIPLNKGADDVGVTFSQRVALGMRLQRLGDAAAPLEYLPRLPGVTGYVAFSQGGDFLDFTQFLNDTNSDGVIDGDDNAVIFRVPFHTGQATPILAGDEPEQLTSARWDCHYPAPMQSRLIASCSHEGSLDIYSLPLEGAVPLEWDDARLSGEIAFARDLRTGLLLSARRLELATTQSAKEAIVREMMGVHLELGEYESTIYYAENRLSKPEAARWGHVIAELARHRRADLALIRGETSEAYIQSERARATALRQLLAGTPGQPSAPNHAPASVAAGDAPASTGAPASVSPTSVAQLAQLVIGEIEDDIGDKAAALRSFRELPLQELADPLLVPLVAARAERLYRVRGDRQSLLEVYQMLASLPLLDVAHRLEYAQRFVQELNRGRPSAARAQAIEEWRAKLPEESELALLLDVEQALLPLNDENQEAVRTRIFELYKQNEDVDRRRALVLTTLRAAALAGNEYLQYQFVNSWASSLRMNHPERKNGEALYRDIVLDRAYGEGRQGQVGESRGYFYGATLSSESLEAHVGFIEARFTENPTTAEAELDQVYEKRFAREPDSPVYAFVKAYRLARGLPREQDADRHDKAVSQVIAYLSGIVDVLPQEPQLHQLWGFALHQRALRRGSREAAVAANRQYLLALDLARGDERLTASLLHRLGLLQASLGNYGSALGYLLRRDEMPHIRPLEELGLRVGIAQSAWHRSDAVLAKQQMLKAAALIEATPSLGAYRPLVIDRLALSLAAAGEAPAAQSRYAELGALLERDPQATPINRLKAKVGLAASALDNGQLQPAIDALSQADAILTQNIELDPESTLGRRASLVGGFRYTHLQYQALVAGLRAGAEQAKGDDPAALEATRRRADLLEKRLGNTGADEDRLELAQACQHLAALHYRLKQLPEATRAVERGLALSAEFNESTGSEVNDAELALIQAYAELHLYGGVRLSALQRDLGGELRRVYRVICKYRNPRWVRQRFLFKIYLTELKLETVTPN